MNYFGSNLGRSWRRVYLWFPFAPVVLASFIRGVLHRSLSGLLSIPAYDAALVAVIAISVFLIDELQRLRIPNTSEDLELELNGAKTILVIYLLFAAALFSFVISLDILCVDWSYSSLESPLNAIRVVIFLYIVMFFREAIQIQSKYKLRAGS